MIYFEHWVLVIALGYFTLAAGLTATAVLTRGELANGAPAAVWLCWMLYAMLLPASQVPDPPPHLARPTLAVARES